MSASPSEAIEARLSDWSTAHAEGPDAAAFLQSQLSSDVASLHVGQAQWSAWLSPKGRVIALILLLRSEQQGFDLLLPDHPADSLVAQLSRFILRRKARLEALPRQDLRAGLNVPPPAGAIALAGATSRWLQPPLSAAGGANTRAIDADWRLLDFASGLPRLDAEGGTHTAHMLSLDRLGAVSLSKGCYPGQEIVARTHYLGQSKRSLVCLKIGAGALPARGAAVTVEGVAVGEVLGAATSVVDGSVHVQAVASRLQGGQGCECEGRVGTVLELAAPPLPIN